ncbi:MAG: class I SAM-dependent methyltransferase [Bacteroidetes bacterium]|nr:class I SAM-dependent methyltransferase [Bacteroidota bacterium]
MQALHRRKETAPYTALAAGYDVVMAHVDYDRWAAYAHERLQAHHPKPRSILELGCGTGSLALALQPRGPYRYRATDGSSEMIRIARRKAELADLPVRFDVADFTDFRVDEPVEAVVLLYDGLNYLLETDRVKALLRCAYAALKPDGLFLLDQSTPANSINNADFFEDEGGAQNFTYKRRSQYDEAARLHTTTFLLTVGGKHFHEQHVQRAYNLGEIRALVQATSFDEVAAYDDFSTAQATEASERIHWVLRRVG